MAREIIDLGTVNDPLTGDTLYVGGGKINNMTQELYARDYNANPVSDGKGYVMKDGVWVEETPFPEAPTDGTQYARQDGAWSAVAAGGGGKLQTYRWHFSAPFTAGNYMTPELIGSTNSHAIYGGVSTLEGVGTSILSHPSGVAKFPQTVISFTFHVGWLAAGAPDRVDLILRKAKWDGGVAVSSSTLYNQEINVALTRSDFIVDPINLTDTSILEGEAIYFALKEKEGGQFITAYGAMIELVAEEI